MTNIFTKSEIFDLINRKPIEAAINNCPSGTDQSTFEMIVEYCRSIVIREFLGVADHLTTQEKKWIMTAIYTKPIYSEFEQKIDQALNHPSTSEEEKEARSRQLDKREKIKNLIATGGDAA